MSTKKFRLGIDTESLIVLLGTGLIIHGVYSDVLGRQNAWRQQLFGAAIVLAGWKGNTQWVDRVLEDAARNYLGVRNSESTPRQESEEESEAAPKKDSD